MSKRPFLLVLILLGAIAAFLFSRFYPKSPAMALQDAVSVEHRAFRNAQWGMHPTEVESANVTTLQPVANSRRFFNDTSTDLSRYHSYEQGSILFLNREARVTYTFHDDRLVAYHVFLSDREGDGLDADMRRYLTRAFGENFSEPEDGSSLKLVWQSKDRIVNYWFMEEPLSLRSQYTAGFGVTGVGVEF